MKLNCAEFQDNTRIPVRYTQEGENVSPPFDWSDVPQDCKSFALICDDVDARKFTHWVIFNLSANCTFLPEGLPSDAKLDLPVLANQGENSFGGIGYDGPMPPVGSGVHRYIFTLYACNKVLSIKPGADKQTVMNALSGSVLAQAQITGLYDRTKPMKQELTNTMRA